MDGNEVPRKTIYERVAHLAGVTYESIRSHQYVLQDLRLAGLVKRPSRGVYRITPKGAEWLQSGKGLTKPDLHRAY